MSVILLVFFGLNKIIVIMIKLKRVSFPLEKIILEIARILFPIYKIFMLGKLEFRINIFQKF